MTVQNARCRVGRQALLSVDEFSVGLGQHWCLFGANGTGKTLLGNLLAGRRIESGSYVSYGARFDPNKDLHIVSFEEQRRLWEHDNRLDISEFSSDAQDRGTLVESLIRASRERQLQDEELLSMLVEQLNLGELLENGIRYLSSGQLRKVLIARALYAYRNGHPQLLILDDPLESVDRDSQEQIRRTLLDCMRENFSSVQLCRRKQDILESANRMAIMERRGSLLTLSEQGEPSEIMALAHFSALSALPNSAFDDVDRLLSAGRDSSQLEAELIRLEGVSANYGDLRVLENIHWTMQGDEHVVIEGPNGCGKSTLLSLIDGENHKAYGQQVFLFGRLKGSGETIWETKRHFGLVSNELHTKYIKGWRVIDVVVSGFYDTVGLYDEGGSTEVDTAKRWIAALGLGALSEQYYHEISFGQQRLVLLARAMVKNPRVLILDEACVGLDDFHRQFILGVLDRIASQSMTNLLYVTHVSDEQPSCINRRLRFRENGQGGYRLEQEFV